MLIVLGALLLTVVYSVFYLLPPVEGLDHLSRIAIFHIPAAWVSVLAFVLSAFWAIRYLQTNIRLYDIKSAAAASLGIGYCIAATVSGAFFARLAWGAFWNWDPRQTSITILLLVYLAYHGLRVSVEYEETRARVSAVYSIIAASTVPFLVFIIPRLQFSLHPSPVLNQAGKLHIDAVFGAVLAIAVSFFTLLFIYLIGILVQRQAADAESVQKASADKKGVRA